MTDNWVDSYSCPKNHNGTPKKEPSPTSSNYSKVDPGEQNTCCRPVDMSGLHPTAWPLHIIASPWALASKKCSTFDVLTGWFTVLTLPCFLH